MQPGIGDDAAFGRIVARPDDRGLFATLGQMAVDAVGADVQRPVGEPDDPEIGLVKAAFIDLRRRRDPARSLGLLATYGLGIDRYLGLGAVADVVDDPTHTQRLGLLGNLSGYTAVKLGWADSLRFTFSAGYHRANYASDSIVPGLADKAACSLAGNLFSSPVDHLDLGVEYRHAQREVVSGLKGQMDRLEMAAKYIF